MTNNFNAFQRMRRKEGYNQVDVAKHLNLSLQSYKTKERGEYEFLLSEAYELARFFGITIDSLHEKLTKWSDGDE